MAEAKTPMAVLHEQFDQARGDDMDGVWAYAVSWRLMRRDVEPDQVCEGLEEALALVRETQESPRDLFGTPDEHSHALYDRWVEEGRLHLWDAGSITWPEVPAWGLGTGSFFSVAFMVTFLLDGRTTLTWTAGLVLLPVGIGVGTAAVGATWDALLRSRGTAAALVGSVAVVASCSIAVATVNEWSKAHPFSTGSTWLYLWVAGVCALLAAALGRWADARPATTTGISDVDDWSRQVAAILRGSYSLADVRVRTIIGDAHAHAADAGRTVEEEFGTPEDYAARFVPDVARRRRLEASLWAFMGAANSVWLAGDFGWFRAAFIAACLAMAWRLWRRPDEPGQTP